MPNHWLMKAEPNSRLEKDKDVKFSVDDFESVKTTPWEGVRNFEARNLMKEMKVGDKVLFYHSNCKIPGVAGFAEVSKEAYPDYTAWDSSHPYFDAKTDKDNPKWFMVEVTFVSRAKNFVPLPLLRHIADSTSSDPPDEIEYIGPEGVKTIKGMALVNRGRLSVQRLEEHTFNVVEMMAEKGGWDDMTFGKKGSARKIQEDGETAEESIKATRKGRSSKKERQAPDVDSEKDAEEDPAKTKTSDEEKPKRGRKRKLEDAERTTQQPTRRSTRVKK